MFETLSDRLTGVLSGLRGKGRLSEADIDATAREIRHRAARGRRRAAGGQGRSSPRSRSGRAAPSVSQALNPAQQVVKIVNEELVAILGGETRRLRVRQDRRRP